MRIVSVVGARPQFIKAAPISKALRAARNQEFLLHTGQHYDYGMSQVFFDELDIPAPDVNLNIGSGPQGFQTGQMLIRIEKILLEEKPDCVLVYGDTNSTLAGVLAAVKQQIPTAHIESGLRSFNRAMPEEHNRVVADHCSDILFCPTQTAVVNLQRESVAGRVYWVGDTMYDAVLGLAEKARANSNVIQYLGLEPKNYLLVTLHRPYNTDDPEILAGILTSLRDIGEKIVFPVHPRTRDRMQSFGLLDRFMNETLIHWIDPLGYLDMLQLEQNARMILTDSGGIQKEAYFFAIPCVTLRPETEWVETVQAGWNLVVGTDEKLISYAVHEHQWPQSAPEKHFGDGKASTLIVEILENNL